MRDWPHSPVHRLTERGAYIVTAGTYRNEMFFRSKDRLDLLCDALLTLAEKYKWVLQAWAVFPNHYHFVALSPETGETLPRFVKHLHSVTAREINRHDTTSGRSVWFEYWETLLTYQQSYFARLSYVHRNAVHHRVVPEPSLYAWCSAGWFHRKAGRSFYRTIMSYPCERVKVPDDFVVDSTTVELT